VSVPQSARSAEFPFRDGTTHFVFEPLVLIERLAALVPPPRMHQLTYHGVLAPGAATSCPLPHELAAAHVMRKVDGLSLVIATRGRSFSRGSSPWTP